MPEPVGPSRGWTPKFIESMKPRATRYELSDPVTPGLILRVHPSGVKSFRWYVRSLERVVVLGPWAFSETPSHLTLSQAKWWLDRLKTARVAGEAELNAVVGELNNQLAPRPADGDDRLLFRKVADEFYEDDIRTNRKRPEQARRILDKDILPVIGARSLLSITTLDCRDVVRRTVDRGAATHAGRVLSLLKQLFNWAQSNGFTDRNPAAPLRPRHLGVVENVCDRCLDTKEIALFWAALDDALNANRPEAHKLRPATAAALKLLLLTGVRTGELLKAQWKNVDLGGATWTIPVADQKLTKEQERRAKPFMVPLSPTAVALFQELRAIADAVQAARQDDEEEEALELPWVMTSPDSADGHYTDKSLTKAMSRLFKPPISLELPGGEATPHDLRRTMRTHLGKLRVPLHVVERCLNHSLGRIVQTYDVGDYLDERREALEKWDAYVLGLLDARVPNVALLAAGER